MTGRDDDSPIRILVVDDHTLLRQAIRDTLLLDSGFQVVAEASDATSAVVAAARTKPDVVLLDIGMPANQPVPTVRRLLEVSPASRIIIVTMYAEPRLIQELVDNGVRGYLHKSVSMQELSSAIYGVVADRRRVVVSVAWQSTPDKGTDQGPTLSAREREVVALVAKALSNRQIASRLDVTEATVKRHLRNIFVKLGAVSRIDVVNKAVDASIIAPLGERGGRP
jgi:DNA-binding NarL/FixJ family response regulator